MNKRDRLIVFMIIFVFIFIYGTLIYKNKKKNDDNTNKEKQKVESKIIVTSQYYKNKRWIPDIQWINNYLNNIPKIIYLRLTSNDNKELESESESKTIENQRKYKLINKGKEALAYLTFIVDHYQNLPDHTIFLHGHNESRHSESLIQILQNFKWGYKGYMNLNWCKNQRCRVRTYRNYSLTFMDNDDVRRILYRYWDETLGIFLGRLPSSISFYCCAQFVATKNAIRNRSLEFYKYLQEWIINTSASDYDSSRLLEYTWPIIMGEPSNMNEENLDSITKELKI